METPLTLEKLHQDVHQALRAWHRTGEVAANSLSYSLLVKAQHLISPQPEEPISRLTINQVLLTAMDTLATQDETAARILQLRFPGNHMLYMVANQFNVSEFTVSRMQRAAIKRLTEIIYRQELALLERKVREIAVSLPPATYTRLFGVAEAQRTLLTRLRQPEGAWVTAVTGLGGMGKTALVRSIAPQLVIELRFADVIWLHGVPPDLDGHSVPSENIFNQITMDLARHFWADDQIEIAPERRFLQVWQRVKQRPFLIIIDNLKSETDFEHLLARLNDLANPSKLLITTHIRPSQPAIVSTHSVNELSFADGTAFISHLVQGMGTEAFASATDTDYQAIWNLTGGHPLALKQVVNLLDILPLTMVLTRLSQGKDGQIEEMYRHIYWQTWQMLSANGRQLLQAMSLMAEPGDDLEDLCRLSGLPESQLWSAAMELRSYSLLEVKGNLRERCYNIHQLTKTFLRTEIVRDLGVNNTS